jgi:hypothetical protein
MRVAVQIDKPFTIDHPRGMLAGKSGDYLVREGQKTWIVDRGIFHQTYQWIVGQESSQQVSSEEDINE